MSDLPQVPTYLTAQNPAQSFAQWGGVGQGIGNSILAIQAQAQSQSQARADAEKAAQLQALKDKAMSVNATNEDRHNLLAAMHPEQYKAIQDQFSSFDKETSMAKQQEGIQAVASLENGDWQRVQDIYNQKADALENAQGDPAKVKEFRTFAQMAKEAPQALADNFKTILLASPDGPAILDSYDKMKAGPQDIKLAEAQTAEAWANALRQKAGRDLTPEADKIINMATDSVTGSIVLATQAENLAKAFDENPPPAGTIGKGLAWLRKQTGGQGKIDQLAQEYTKLRNTDVLKNLPPGVASDKDIEIAMAAFPDDTANPETISRFLKGMAKLQRYNAEVNKAKAEWVAQNGNLGPIRSDEGLTITKKPAPKGTSFWDFTSTIEIPNVVSSEPSVKVATGSFGGTAPATIPTGPNKTVKGKY